MAVEQNPFEQINPMQDNVVPMPNVDEAKATFELDDDGGVLVDFTEETTIEMGAEESVGEWYRNLRDDLEEDELQDIGRTLYDNYESDKSSRNEWESMFERGFDLLGLKIEETSEPFEGACTAVHPLLIESAVKFQSKASQELFPPNGPVKAQILGKHTLEKENQAMRVQNFMNYQLTEQMPEYFDEFERMLFHLPLIGSSFKKIYYDASFKRPISEFIPIDQFYVSYNASNLRNADRYTHVIYKSPVDLYREIKAEMYSDIDLPEAGMVNPTSFSEKMDTIIGLSPSSDSDPQYVLLEQHCYLDIADPQSEDGESLPYIVTIEEQSKQVLSIRRNYAKDDPTKQKKVHFVHYRFVPGFGFYGLGLMHFLGNLTMSATAAMRALIDAGQFANLPGGFKAKGVRMVGNNEPIAPGEFKEVEATGIDLNKAIISLPYKEPSSTLYQMLQFVTAAGQKFADSTEQIVSDAASYGPVGTTMALLEASSKFFTAIHKRLHKSQRDEFKILASIDKDYLPQEYPYEVPLAERSIFQSDFDGKVDVIPVSDPNIPSNAHRMMLANMALQMAQQSPPGMFNTEALNRTILSAANMPNLDEILPPKPEPKPLDPVSDIMAAVKGIPIAAFPGQNHDAHIQVKMAYLQDPMNGANPIMQRVQPVLQANIQEHSVMKYQEQVNGIAQKELGTVAPESAQKPQVIELALMETAKQVQNANQAMGIAQSPEQQMVSLEQAKVELEKQKMQMDLAVNNAEVALENKKLDLEENKQMMEATKAGITTAMKDEKAEADRASKETIKAIEMLTKILTAQMKEEGEDKRSVIDLVRDQADQKNKTDMKAVDMILNLIKETTNA
jgi:chaperonin GroES